MPPKGQQGPQGPGDDDENPNPYLIQVVVRDSRLGRDPARVTSEGGEVLGTFESEFPYHVGDVLELRPDDRVVVVEMKERISRKGWFQLLHVGDSW